MRSVVAPVRRVRRFSVMGSTPNDSHLSARDPRSLALWAPEELTSQHVKTSLEACGKLIARAEPALNHSNPLMSLFAEKAIEIEV